MVQICSSCNKTIPLQYTAFGDNGLPLNRPVISQPPPPTTSGHVTSERDIRYLNFVIFFVNEYFSYITFECFDIINVKH